MITQSTGCDFGEDNYIAIRLCCDFHDGMTKNSRNKEYEWQDVYNSRRKKCILSVYLILFSSFMCQYSKVVDSNKLSIGIHRYLVTAIPPVISFNSNTIPCMIE